MGTSTDNNFFIKKNGDCVFLKEPLRKFILEMQNYNEINISNSSSCCLIEANCNGCHGHAGFYRIEWIRNRLEKGLYPDLTICPLEDGLRVCYIDYSHVLSDDVENHLRGSRSD